MRRRRRLGKQTVKIKTTPPNILNLMALFCFAFPGWKMGFEPTTNGTTIRYSNLLSYIHHFEAAKISEYF